MCGNGRERGKNSFYTVKKMARGSEPGSPSEGVKAPGEPAPEGQAGCGLYKACAHAIMMKNVGRYGQPSSGEGTLWIHGRTGMKIRWSGIMPATARSRPCGLWTRKV